MRELILDTETKTGLKTCLYRNQYGVYQVEQYRKGERLFTYCSEDRNQAIDCFNRECRVVYW